jgi:hypothetical protein
MEQSGDGFVFAAAVFENNRGHGDEVRDIGDLGALA